MKTLFKYSLILLALATVASCNKDELSPTSVILDSLTPETEFDQWLEVNYREPYNIRYLYRYEDIESDMDYDLVPADELCSRILAKLLQYLWLDAYNAVADEHFLKENAPRVIAIIGSGAYNTNGTLQLGTAEGGLKITFYVTNWLLSYGFVTIEYNNGEDESEGYTVTDLDMDSINTYYLRTMHHEFGHILNQNKSYPTDFNTISQGDYVAQWNSLTDSQARQMGFVSAYASSGAGEDFVEVLSYYIASSDTDWQAILSEAGTSGAEIINRKLTMVSDYMEDSWNIDLDELRSELNTRYSEAVTAIDWSNFSTED